MRNQAFLFLRQQYSLSSLRNGPRQKRCWSSLDFVDLFGVTELYFFVSFERRYEESSASLKLRLVVWNRDFQKGHNPSSFKLPFCATSKTRAQSVCCLDKVKGRKETVAELFTNTGCLISILIENAAGSGGRGLLKRDL